MAFYDVGWSLIRAVIGIAVRQSVIFTALKGFLTTVILVFLPTVFMNVFGKFLLGYTTQAIGLIDSDILSGATSVVYTITGLAAFFATHLHLVEAFSIIVSAMASRFILRFIPFIGW